MIDTKAAAELPKMLDAKIALVGGKLSELVYIMGIPSDLVFAPVAQNWVEYNRMDKPMKGELAPNNRI
eukprot:GDKH01012481.1.p2 GENE.GDKH01012481.1~~GDKH01012481.1.p2  ORF type:complete len:68 (+),score=21.16 GDKH01012481.1:1-204(+)